MLGGWGIGQKAIQLRSWELDVEQEVDNVAIFHDVVFTFDAEFAGFFDGLFVFEFFEVGEGVDFSADEAPFEVGVNDTRGLRGGGTYGNGPSADFFFTGCKVRMQAQEVIGCVGDGFEGGFFEAQGFEHFQAFAVGHGGEFGFDLGADGNDLRAFFGGVLTHLHAGRALAFEVIFIDIHDVEHALAGDEAQLLELLELIGVIELDGSGRVALLKHGKKFAKDFVAGDVFGLTTLGRTLGFADGAFDALEVGEGKFDVDDFDIAEGINAAADVEDFFAPGCFGEAADDLKDGIDFADVGEKLVAEAFTDAGTFDNAGDINEF